MDEKESRLCEAFAFKFLSAAASRVVTKDDFCSMFSKLSLADKQGLQTAQASAPIDPSSTALQTSKDVLLLVYIFRSQGKNEEALWILCDEKRTGLQSAIAAGSWELMAEKVKLLELCGYWQELWNTCYAVLLDANLARSGSTDIPVFSYGGIGDDFSMWKGLARAASNIGSEQIISKTCDAFKNMTFLSSRNRFLGRLEFELHPLSTARDKSDLLSSLFGYQNQYRASPSNFRDISHFMARIAANEKWPLLLESAKLAEVIAPQSVQSQEAMAIKWIRSELNSLKLDYNVVVSAEHNLSNTVLLETFAANCLRLYQISLQVEQGMPVTERRCGDDAAILAAMACIHLAHQNRSYALLQGTAILEKLLISSMHNYDAILLLVRVYLYQGAVSRAFELYERLDVKNIQAYTLSWTLLTRISTIHPHTSNTKRCDPHILLRDYLLWLQTKLDVSPTILQKHVENDNPMGLCETLQLQHLLRTSNTRFLLAVECDRILWRLNDPDRHKFRVPTIEGNLLLADIRDSAAVPNYEHHGQPAMDQYVRPGPVPSDLWVKLQIGLAHLRHKFSADVADMDVATFLTKWDSDGMPGDLKSNTEQLDDADLVELTDQEFQCLRLSLYLIKALKSMATFFNVWSNWSSNESPLQDLRILRRAEDDIHTAIGEIENAITDCSYWKEVNEQPQWYFESMGWEFFHEYYMEGELIVLYTCFLNIVLLFSMRVTLYATTFPSGETLPESLCNPQFWIGALREISRGVSEKNVEIGSIVRKLQGIYRGGDYVKQMRRKILEEDNSDDSSGFRKALDVCLGGDFVGSCCRTLADSWVDCLDGLIGGIRDANPYEQ